MELNEGLKVLRDLKLKFLVLIYFLKNSNELFCFEYIYKKNVFPYKSFLDFFFFFYIFFQLYTLFIFSIALWACINEEQWGFD